MRIAYLCDGEGCRSEFRTCQREDLDALLRCRHTTDPRHAVNGPCDTPEMEPERPALLPLCISTMTVTARPDRT